MEKDWGIVRAFGKLFLAEIAKEVLVDNNIDAIIINKKDSSYQSFGDIELYVHNDNIEKAKELIKEV